MQRPLDCSTGVSAVPRKRRALVTGGAGFIGSHLCDRLLAEGYRVVCMDNLQTGVLDNISHVNDLDFEFIDHDVTLHINLPDKLDEIYHFASPASPVDFKRIPIAILKVGALGTHNALGLAKAHNARLMLASTSEVYGDPLEHPQQESYWGNVNSIGIRGVYDEAKRYAEAMTMAYHRYHGIDTRIVRIFNTYGPRTRLDDGRMVPNFIQQTLAGEPLTIYGEGTQTRSVQYVDDLIEGVLRLMYSLEAYPVNIGHPRELSVREIAEMVLEISGSKSGISYNPLPQDDPKQRCPDITRARELLAWEPRVPAEVGIRRTFEWFAGRHKRIEAS
jgi:dTDP-glucose 4,6-dehydratase